MVESVKREYISGGWNFPLATTKGEMNYMKRKTSIRNIANVLCYDPMAQIVKAEYRYKAQSLSDTTDAIDAVTMLESIESLEDNVVFADLVAWTYENVSEKSDTDDFILYGDLHDSIVGTIVVVHLRLVDGHTVEHVEDELNKRYLTILSKQIGSKGE